MSKGGIFDRLRSLFGRNKQPAPPPPQDAPKQPGPAAPDVVRPTPAPTVTLYQDVPPNPPLTLQPRPAATPTPADPVPGTSIQPARPVCQLTLGIDFGTSCSKVVIGDPGWAGKSYPVPLRPSEQGVSRFLLPTKVTLNGNDSLEANLKMRLTDNPDSVELRIFVALYLADLIERSTTWFAESGPAVYRTRTPEWNLNIGFPEKSVAAQPLVHAYRGAASLASALLASKQPRTIENARCILQRGPASPPFIPDESVHFYPEIAAQLAGYVNSRFRTRGNMLLIDVGAGTLDVSTLILHGREDAEIVSFHFCQVKPLGALRLFETRCAALAKAAPSCLGVNLLDFQDGTTAIPDAVTAMLAPGVQASSQHHAAFNRASSEFSKAVLSTATGCLVDFRKNLRKRHSSASYDPWPGTLRFFLSGGGSRLPFYKNHLVDGPLEQLMANFTRWDPEAARRRSLGQGLRLEKLPVPEDLVGLPPQSAHDFDRLSVAHGLAYGQDNLMRITSTTHS